MCGRARCTLNAHQVAQACGAPNASSLPTLHRYRPSCNVSPGAHLPVFRVRTSPDRGQTADAEAVVDCMKWGLIPSFTKKNEKPDHYRMFNARSETIKEKASFRRLIPNNRCLVAVEGFYEWKKDGSKKQPYYIHFKDNQPLVFAALYDSWETPEGEILHTFTILTTRSSLALQWLHDRMPVILRDIDSINLWVSNSTDKHETILRPCEDPDLVWYPVTPAMGKPSFDGPECIKEIQLKPVEKPLSMFFPKKTEVKHQSEPESLKSPKEEQATESFQEPITEDVKEKASLDVKDLIEPIVEDAKAKVAHDLKDHIEPSTEDTYEKVTQEPEVCGIKREFKQIETKQTGCMKKKGKVIKNPDDTQASLLSYFAKR